MTNVFKIQQNYPNEIDLYIALLQNCCDEECKVHEMIEWAKIINFSNNFYNYGGVKENEILVTPIMPHVKICEKCTKVALEFISSMS